MNIFSVNSGSLDSGVVQVEQSIQCVCLYVNADKPNDLWPTYLASWFILVLYRSGQKVMTIVPVTGGANVAKMVSATATEGFLITLIFAFICSYSSHVFVQKCSSDYSILQSSYTRVYGLALRWFVSDVIQCCGGVTDRAVDVWFVGLFRRVQSH